MNKKQMVYNSDLILKKNSELIESTKRNNLIKEEGERDNKESLQAEEVIAILIRNQDMDGFQIADALKSRKSPDFKFVWNYFTSVIKKPMDDEKEVITTVQRAVVKIRSFGLPSDAKQYGTTKELPVEEWYSTYNGEPNKIMPKTDVLNSEKHHSVKMKGPVHVLDASKKQLGALCLYTLDRTDEKVSKKVSDGIKKEIDEIQSIVTKLSRIPDENKYKKFASDYKKKHPKANADAVRDAAKKEKLIVPMGDIISGKVVLSAAAQKSLKEFNDKVELLNTKVESIFSKIKIDDSFKRVFLTESISGDFMFGRKEASANSIITWEPRFKNLEMLSITEAVNELLPSFRPPKFESKSSGNWGTSVAKLTVDLQKIVKNQMAIPQDRTTSDVGFAPKFESIVKENMKGMWSKTENIMMFVESIHHVIESYKKQLLSNERSLKEGTINELSFIEKSKSIFNKIVNAIKVVGKKVAEYFLDLKEVLSGLPSDIFNFFGMQVEVEPEYKVEIQF